MAYLIGPWLRMFIGVLLTVIACESAEDNQFYKLKAIIHQPLSSVTNDMKQFQQAVVSDDWNENIFIN